MKDLVVIVALFWTGPAGAAATPVDYARDVRPILQEHCYQCHGPVQQRNGLRLDRRREAMRGGTGTVITAGSSPASRLYLRLVGDRYGTRMPPSGPLDAPQIETLKAWIDQGAPWPDALSSEEPTTPPDPRVTRMVLALRDGDEARWRRTLREDPAVVGGRGPGGATPLMYAVLYGDARSVRAVLEANADPNARNDAGATALMWAAGEPGTDKLRLLLDQGADPNLRSHDNRTALVAAAEHPDALAAVKLLLARGASPTVKNADSPLGPALSSGNEPVVRLLLRAGADLDAAGPEALPFAIKAKCAGCTDLLIGAARPGALDRAITALLPPLGGGDGVSLLLARGASPATTDKDGRTLLMLAASAGSTTAARALLARGLDVQARSPRGETALSLARQMGETPLVGLLRAAGARDESAPLPQPPPAPASSIAEALRRALPPLQRAADTFSSRSGCVSCHHNTLTAATVAAARQLELPVDEALAGKQGLAMITFVHGWQERVLQGRAPGGKAAALGAILLGLGAARQLPDLATDAMARYVKSKQLPDGHWVEVAHRPPSGSSPMQATAIALRALRLYAPPAQSGQYERAVQRAAGWLLRATPRTTDEKTFTLLGLRWAGQSTSPAARRLARALLAEQRPDGGWAQLSSLPSDPFATGQALVGLHEVGALTASDPAYQRGVQRLLSTQLADGSWYVRTRAIPLQPPFEGGFPHGADQWISAAATNWAALALVCGTGSSRSCQP
jgi:ankyrin repeat protein